jgi:hypothetical protein
MDFDFEDSNTFDVADLFGGDVASSGVDLSALGTDLQELDLSNLFSNSDGQGVDFSGLDNLDISSLLSGGDNFMPGDFGRSLADELASTSLSTGRASSLFSDDGGFSMNALFRNDGGENSWAGTEDAPAPPSNIAELLTSMNPSSAENLSKTDFNALYNEGLTPEQIAAREKQMDFYKDKTQDFGGADVMKYFDEYDKNMTDIMQNKGGFTSQWQDVGGNKVMINDDPQGGSTATVFNPTTGQTSYLTEEQTQALIANGTLNTKGSGYVAATGGTGVVQGGGRTFFNEDGTKTVVTPDGKVLKVDGDGKVTDTGKKVDVNDEKAVVATCPSPEMLILLSSGEQRKAGDLQVGDEVKTQHETTMEWGNFKVTHAEIIPNAKRLNII